MRELPAGTVTFLFTDIEGSTRRWELFHEEMKLSLARHDAIMRAAIEAHGGVVFQTGGDSFVVAFATAPAALGAALEAQRSLLGASWEEPVGQIKVRMGLHSGPGEYHEDGYHAEHTLNRLARLLSSGHGGQILLSGVTRELLREHLPPGVDVRDMGERRLKDLIEPLPVFQVVAPAAPWGLPAEFPPLKTLDARPTNLPAQPTPLVGREEELAAAVALMRRDEIRLATFTGPGGMGKTRLASQVAAELIDDFQDGVFFVNLAPIADPDLVAQTISQALGVEESPDQALPAALKDHLRGRQLLLLLDNFEQVVAAAPLVAELLAAAPRLKVLATSRIVLRLRGEHEFPVSPLALPDTKRLPPLEHLTQYAAVRLFIERAVASKPDFAVSNENAPAVAEICVRLDGLPLAIELAAARIKALPPHLLLARLENRLKVLTGGRRDLPARHQTLRGTIEWSYDLLEQGEQVLFRRLAVFRGGRTLEAIEAVCASDGGVELDPLDGVTSLLDKSLLYYREGAGKEPRYWMLETIHEYARERLASAGEAEQLSRLHAGYFAALGAQAREHLQAARQAEWFARLGDEVDNIRAALGWAVEQRDAETAARLATSVWRFWEARGYITEGRKWLEAIQALDGDLPTLLRGRLLYAAAGLASDQQDYGRALAFYEEYLALYRGLGDKKGIAGALSGVAGVAHMQGDYARAQPLYEEALSLYREIGDEENVPRAMHNLALVLFDQGHLEPAAALYEESLELTRAQGEMRGIAWTLITLAEVSMARDDYERAKALDVEALALCRELAEAEGSAMCMEGLAAVARQQGAPLVAARLYAAAAALRQSIGVPVEAGHRARYEEQIAAARARAEAAEWDAAWQEGYDMSLERATEYAMAEARLGWTG